METDTKKKSLLENLNSPAGTALAALATVLLSAGVLRLAASDPGADLTVCLYTAVSALTLCGSSVCPLGWFSPAGVFFIAFLSEAACIFYMAVFSYLILRLGYVISIGKGEKSVLFTLMDSALLRRLTVFILIYAAAAELVGAGLFLAVFLPAYGPAEAIGYALFTSVSAFTGCGFSLLGESALYTFSLNYMYDAVCAVMLAVSALGPLFAAMVLSSDRTAPLFRSLRIQAVFLLALGIISAASVCALEWDGTLPWQTSLSTGILAVLAKSAGSLAGAMRPASLRFPSRVILAFLMITGGLPGSSAGGLRTGVCLMILVWLIFYPVSGEPLRAGKMTFTKRSVSKAVYMALSFTAVCGILSLALSAASEMSYSDVLFETVSLMTLSGTHTAAVAGEGTAFLILSVLAMLAGRIQQVFVAWMVDNAVSSRRPGKVSDAPPRDVVL